MSGVLPDPRRHAYRVGLAAESLRGHVEAPRYVAGVRRQIEAPALPLRREPRFDATLDTEGLFGETLNLFDESEGWAWVQLARDGYVGYMPSESLAATVTAPTHKIAALRTYVYPSADFKTPPLTLLSLNALVSVAGEEGRFLALKGGGFVIAEHARTLEEHAPDFVDVALAFRGTPYLWGGRTSAGIDCSGLVQVSMQGAGLPCPRDSDMQEAELGERLGADALDTVKRGDLLFWRGHVGIVQSPEWLLHASGHQMEVVVEPVLRAVERLAATHGTVTSIRRVPGLPEQS